MKHDLQLKERSNCTWEIAKIKDLIAKLFGSNYNSQKIRGQNQVKTKVRDQNVITLRT